MLVLFVLTFLFMSCATINEEERNIAGDDYNYNNWPFNFNAVRLNVIRRDVQQEKEVQTDKDTNSPSLVDIVPQKLIPDSKSLQGQTEGGVVNDIQSPDVVQTIGDNINDKPDLVTLDKNVPNKTDPIKEKENSISKADAVVKSNNDTKTDTGTNIKAQPISKVEEPPASNNIDKSSEEVDLNNPGVLKRGLIVFGGLSLLAVAYFIFYKNKHKKFDSSNTHNTGDSNQFRYGVLHSDDRRENLELSRIPLTMESDEDEDEDLEIFDLEQKKRSLSYVNLQTNDEDIVLRSSKDESKNNLLLDIEDGSADQLINWSGNGSKSIL